MARLVLAVLLAATVWGQMRSEQMNPAHLREMPGVESVIKAMAASNPRDSVARAMGAFAQLQEVVEELSQGRTAIGTETPDERKVLGEYRSAYYAVQATLIKGPGDEHMLQELRRFDEDPALREELLTRFFSPALQGQSRSVSRVLQARLAAFRKQNAANGGVVTLGTANPSPSAPARATATAAPARPALPPDPSIAKAIAAGVDTKVLGLQLGDVLSLPKCRELVPQSNCVPGIDVMGLVSSFGKDLGIDLDGNLVTVAIGKNSCPAWLAGCTATAILDEANRLLAVSISTPTNLDRDVREALSEKYGKRFSVQERHITPDNGSATFTVYDVDWNLTGLHIHYSPVDADIHTGSILIETGARAAQRELNKKNAPKL